MILSGTQLVGARIFDNEVHKMFSNTVSLAVGVGIGIYIAQNYNLPDIKKLLSQGLKVAKTLEKAARKEGEEK